MKKFFLLILTYLIFPIFIYRIYYQSSFNFKTFRVDSLYLALCVFNKS